MKYIIPLFGLFTFALAGFSQQRLIFNNLKSDTLLCRLYDCISTTPDGETLKQSGLWKPNLNEQLNSKLDGYSANYQTQFDTILYYQKAETNGAIAVFTTYNPENPAYLYGVESGPMKGLALFEKVENHWKITQFKKMFNTSEYAIDPIYSIEKLGEDLLCLKQHNASEFFGGHDVASTQYFSLSELSEIFSYRRYYSSNTSFELENEDSYTAKTKLNMIKTKPNYTIELITTTSTVNENKPNFKKVRIKKSLFKYSRADKKYVKASH
jgi:hypothetical protein